MKIAVIGAGISGNLVARLLSAEHEVELLEAADYAGGHTNTVDVAIDGRAYPVDTGFMVFNERTYPQFSRLLEALQVPSRAADMSFGVRCDLSGLEYQGSSLNGLFAQRSNLVRPRFYGMLRDIFRFNASCRELLEQDDQDDRDEVETLGEFVRRRGLGTSFAEDYLAPMCAAIWSAPPQRALDAPARYFVRFFQNHGLIQLRDRPPWRTVVGGARRYVEALLSPLASRVRLSTPVRKVVRHPHYVTVETSAGEEVFDQVVLATHADVSLRLLADADEAERDVLSAFPYQENTAVLHTDTSVLPSRRRAWASWNFRRLPDPRAPLSVSYDVSRLQGHDSPRPILVTLNDESIRHLHVVQRIGYSHPQFHVGTPRAQQRHDEINGRRRTYFAGAYWGYGFHEDGVRSALAVAARFGTGLEDLCTAACTSDRFDTVAAER